MRTKPEPAVAPVPSRLATVSRRGVTHRSHRDRQCVLSGKGRSAGEPCHVVAARLRQHRLPLFTTEQRSLVGVEHARSYQRLRPTSMLLRLPSRDRSSMCSVDRSPRSSRGGMSRLRCLPLRLGTTAPRLGTGATAGSGFVRTDGRSAAARGYDAAWRRLRLDHLAANPLCEKCRRGGRVTAATQVHHIRRFNGLDDPLRLDSRNLESICDPCHRRESAAAANRRG